MLESMRLRLGELERTDEPARHFCDALQLSALRAVVLTHHAQGARDAEQILERFTR
jgi:hypothetical protein